jgi:chloramphenicol 3-O phosphotransferase
LRQPAADAAFVRASRDGWVVDMETGTTAIRSSANSPKELGRIILVNGPSGVGKSTLIRSLHDSVAEPYLLTGIDYFYHVVPRQWAGGPEGRYRRAGFQYVDWTDQLGELSTIESGAYGDTVVRSMHSTIEAWVHAGANVIVDGIHPRQDLVGELNETLATIPRVLKIGLTASDEYLEARSIDAKNRPGLWRHQARTIHDGFEYDLFVDRTNLDTNQLCEYVIAQSRGFVWPMQE